MPCFVLIFFISHKRYSIGEVLKCNFFQNPRIANLLTVESDVKPQTMTFVKVDRSRRAINREGRLYG